MLTKINIYTMFIFLFIVILNACVNTKKTAKKKGYQYLEIQVRV